jgi:nucleoside-triphosphatase THEP1
MRLRPEDQSEPNPSSAMSDSPCDLAALVYEKGQDPDALLRDFAAELSSRGFRAVGLVQVGDRSGSTPQLSAMLVHSGEQLRLFQDLGPQATGCKLDVGQLLDAGAQVARAIDDGADLVIINRFGRQECEGGGLSYLVERALSAGIPVVIAVPAHRFADWIKFAEGMSVKLRCDRESLDGWWHAVRSLGAREAREASQIL